MFQPFLNPTQSANNLLKVNKANACCDDTEGLCSYVITHTEANTVQTLTISEAGVNKALTVTPGGTTAVQVRDGIQAALEAAGYREDGKGTEGVTVVDNGATHTVTITGLVKVVNIITSGGTESATANCTAYGTCTYTLRYGGGTTPSFSVDGVAGSALSTITYGSTTTGAVDTAITNALSAQSVTASVTVTDDTANSVYVITFAYDIDHKFAVGGQFFDMSNCTRAWKV
jgi:hypothetical protein